MSGSASEIRGSLEHPVIDSDGHLIEFQPAAMTYLEEIAGARAVERLPRAWQMRIAPDPQQRIDEQLMRTPFWNFPTRNTRDRASVALPALLRERMEELGFDFMVLYPTMGLIANEVGDDEVRAAACRAFNTYNAELCAEFSDRMTPAAVIPMHTARGGDRGARARRGGAAPQGGDAGQLRAPAAARRPAPGSGCRSLRLLVRHLRSRQPLRLRPRLAPLRRARRLPDVPHRHSRAREPGARAPTTSTITSDTSRPPGRRSAARSSCRASRVASRNWASASSRAAWAGAAVCWPI